jgi:hypothetical protein
MFDPSVFFNAYSLIANTCIRTTLGEFDVFGLSNHSPKPLHFFLHAPHLGLYLILEPDILLVL